MTDTASTVPAGCGGCGRRVRGSAVIPLQPSDLDGVEPEAEAGHRRDPVHLAELVGELYRRGGRTADGRQYQAHSLIAATGAFHRPHLPQLPVCDPDAGRHLALRPVRPATPRR